MTQRIWVFTPYCHRDEGQKKGRDLGHAYNEYMRLVPEGDWALFLDHDIAFLTSAWFRQCEAAIAAQPDAGMFTCMTTRLRPGKSGWQMAGPRNCHDMVELRKVASQHAKDKGPALRDVTTVEQRGGMRPTSGFFMLISKQAWNAIGGTSHGFVRIDWAIHNAISEIGKKVYLIEGLLVWHWFKGKQI